MIFDKEYEEAKIRFFGRDMAANVINSLDEVGTWVKDEHYRFLDVSEPVSNRLYGVDSRLMLGKTDYEVAKEMGVNMSEHQFADICLASDALTLNTKKTNTFIEFITSNTGEKMVWRVVKGIKIKDKRQYLWGFATFLENIFGNYESAMQFAYREKKYCEEINANLWVFRPLNG